MTRASWFYSRLPGGDLDFSVNVVGRGEEFDEGWVYHQETILEAEVLLVIAMWC